MKTRKLSSQLISLVVIIVLVASLLSLVISDQISNLVFKDYEENEMLVLGFAFKEILMPVIAILLSWFQMHIYAKGVVAPITALTRATMRIAKGDFDTQIKSDTTYSELAMLQANFNMMARELKTNEVLKKDFVTNVSHEFKTPLAVVKGYADLLSSDDITDDERREYAEAISREIEHLSQLTSNILRMSRLNNQEIIVDPKFFSLDEQIRRTVLLLEKKWSDKELELDLQLEQVRFKGDEELLSQVWLNLIDNAIKYTGAKGAITITLAMRPNGDIVADVIDTGVGMSEKECIKVFEQFYQADSSRKREGNGLGLAIAYRIVKLHNGTITVKSEKGKGSDFKVVLHASK